MNHFNEAFNVVRDGGRYNWLTQERLLSLACALEMLWQNLLIVDRTRNKMNRNVVTGQIVDAAMKVHSKLGPGLLESAYEACLAFELRKRSLCVQTQVALPVIYENVKLDIGYRLDLLVESQVIVELKAVEKMIPLFDAQLISYLKLSGMEVGLLINFHVERLKYGIKRL